MKYRNSFVTNSSSSSFIISKQHLTPMQVKQINNYFEVAEEVQTEEDEYGFGIFGWLDNDWTIEEDEDYICGRCVIDNFDMCTFLEYIGAPVDKVYWNDWCYDLDIMKVKYEVEYGER